MSLTESSSNCGRGKRAKARYSSVSASRAPTWSRMAPTRPLASAISGSAPLAHDVAEHLGVELDGGDGVAHLVGHLEREPAHRGHALGHNQLLLGGLEAGQRPGELGVEPLHLGAGAPLAVGDVAEREGGQPDQAHEDHHRRPRRGRRRQPARQPEEEPGDQSEEQADGQRPK